MIALDTWKEREQRCDRITELAAGFFEPERESAGWLVTGWPASIVEGAEVRQAREWLTCSAERGRLEAFHSLLTAEELVGGTSWHEGRVSVMPR